MTNLNTIIEEEKKVCAQTFREKWGRFYISMNIFDWEKPSKQNVTGGIPHDHDGYCLASDDMEKQIQDFLTTAMQRAYDKGVKDGKIWTQKTKSNA